MNFSALASSSELIGYIAATLTTISFAPQAWLTFRTKDASGVSLGMYSVFTVGISLWLLYGLSLGALPIVIANGFTLVFAFAILGMKLSYGSRRPEAPTESSTHTGA
jgi:MtN3 and saliva related transmembrane protein